MNIPLLGENLPQKDSGFLQTLGRSFLGLFGWRFEGAPPNLSKLIVIAAPHTSNWDLPLGVAVIWALGVQLAWLGKHTLFKGLFGKIFRALGGLPVDRRASSGVVDQMVAEFEKRHSFILALAPEGTRSKVTEWRTGFYHISNKSNVPILPVALDYDRKVIKIGPPFEPTGNFDKDLGEIKSFFKDIIGKRSSDV